MGNNHYNVRNKRVPLPLKEKLWLTKDICLLSCLSECGGSSITYLAKTGAGIKVIKELYPLFSEEELCRSGYKIEVKGHPESNSAMKEKIAQKAEKEQSITELLCSVNEEANSIFHFTIQDITDDVLAYNPEFEGTVARYLASDTLYGRTLTDILSGEHEFTLEEAMAYSKKILRPIRRMHEQKKMLHLDLKCDNVFFPNELMQDTVFQDETYCILLDCGGAQPLKLEENNWTVSVSEGYSAIELQMIKKYTEDVENETALKKYLSSVGTHTDLYSVMAICYRMLMGKSFQEEAWKMINTSGSHKEREQSIRSEIKRRLEPEYPYLVDRVSKMFCKAFYYHPFHALQEHRYMNCDELVVELSTIQEILQNKGIHPEIAVENSLKQFELLKNSVKMKINPKWFGEVEEQ